MRIKDKLKFIRCLAAISAGLISVYISVTHAATVEHSKFGSADEVQQYRTWIQSMKTAERGPFSRLRWFCEDGSVLAPKAYACAERGGGPVSYTHLTLPTKA